MLINKYMFKSISVLTAISHNLFMTPEGRNSVHSIYHNLLPPLPPILHFYLTVMIFPACKEFICQGNQMDKQLPFCRISNKIGKRRLQQLPAIYLQ